MMTIETDIQCSVHVTGMTDIGRVRNHNEDAIAWDVAHGFALLADGMGGHNAGDVASHLCLEILSETLQVALDKPLLSHPDKNASQHTTLVRCSVNRANTVIFDNAETNPEHKGMGTTLAMVLFYENKVVVAHVGDSRVYRLRGDMLEQITADHSLVGELLKKGTISAEEAENNSCRHIITRAMGLRSRVVSEIQELETRPGDVFLLCSDGLTDLVSDAAIAETLLATGGGWSRAAQYLIDLANNNGGRDNISVVIAALGGPR